MSSLEITMLEAMSYGFFQRAFISSLVIGTICPLIGVFIILKGISFIGAGTAHAAFAGVTLGYLAGIDPSVTAFTFALGTVWTIGALDLKGQMKSEAYIGIFYTITMALAILFIGLMTSYNAEVYGYLFGSILTISPNELYAIIILGLIVLVTVRLFFKELHFICTDYDMAEASGIPAALSYFIMLSLIATTIMVGLKAVGSLLVFAMMLIPAASAYQLASSMRGMVIISIAVGIISSVGGLFLSYFFDIPSGATIILFSGAIFLTVAITSKKQS